MFGGGYLDNVFPYNVYDYPRAPSRGGYRRPRAPEFDQYGFSEPGYGGYVNNSRQPTASFRNQEAHQGRRGSSSARNVAEAPTMKTIPVEDGGARESLSQKVFNVVPTRKARQFDDVHLAAMKIQSVYRGYVVRKTEPLKHLKVIGKVRTELQALMRKSDEPEQHEKLCKDPQERYKWIEGVMALLLRLDSLQGVLPVVRDIRKSVAKEAIQFQERIDSMSDAAAIKVDKDNKSTVEEADTKEMEDGEAEDAEGVFGVEDTKPAVARAEDVSENMSIENECTLLGNNELEMELPNTGTEGMSPTGNVSPHEEWSENNAGVVEMIDAVNDSLEAADCEEISTVEQNMSAVQSVSAGMECPEGIISTSTAPIDERGANLSTPVDSSTGIVEEAPALTESIAAGNVGIEQSTLTHDGAAMDVDDDGQTLMEMSAKNIGEEAVEMERTSMECGLAMNFDDSRAPGSSTHIQSGEELIANGKEEALEMERHSTAGTSAMNVKDGKDEALGVENGYTAALRMENLPEQKLGEEGLVGDRLPSDRSEVGRISSSPDGRDSFERAQPLEDCDSGYILPRREHDTNEELADALRDTKEQEQMCIGRMDVCDTAIVGGGSQPWTSLTNDSPNNECLQVSLREPTTIGDNDTLTNRELLQQILEENRKLKTVVGEVLQWGKQQSNIINNLSSRIEQLEAHISDGNLLENSLNVGRKRIGSKDRPIGARERVSRRLENGCRNGWWGNRNQISYLDSEDQWPSSAESEEYF